MMLYFAGGGLTLAVVAWLLWPLWHRREETARQEREATIYQDQLAELARDQDRGIITDDQASAARQEIERRLLGALRREKDANLQTSPRVRFAAAALTGLLPFAAGGMYLSLGSPDQPDQPFAGRTADESPMAAAPAGTHSEMRDRISALEERLAENPRDLEGQALLARSYASIGDYPSALRSYAEANRLAEGSDRRLAGEYAEVMVLENDGMVPPNAESIFSLINEDFPNDPQSSYYLALAKAQRGQEDEAVADLVALRQASPADAPWLEAVESLLASLSPVGMQQPIDDQRFAGPTPEMVAAAQDMSANDRNAMIDGMVQGLADRLAENPEDVDGWRRLARAYEVLGRQEDAAAAHREVLARAPNDPVSKAFIDGR